MNPEVLQGPYSMNADSFLILFVFVVIFALIIWEKIPRVYSALFGAVLVIVLGVFDIKEAINFVSWETIGFLLGMFLLVEILVEAGFFRWVALDLARRLNYEPLKILLFFPFLAFVLSAFLNSITVMAFLAVITFELSGLLKFDPLPVIVSEVVLSNIGGAATLVGDPPNVILGTGLGFGFNDFLIHNAPVAILSGLAAVWVSFLMNKKNFVQLHPSVDLKNIREINPRSQIKDTFLLKCGLVGMGFTLIFLIGRPIFAKLGLPISISMASLLPAFTLLVLGGKRIHKHHFLRRTDAETLLFFIGLFILIGALEKKYIIQIAADFLASLFRTPVGFLSSVYWGSGIFSGFVDNVPLAMAMIFIIKQSVAQKIVPATSLMVWATSLGVDLGGNLTPIGASANVVAYSYLEKTGKKVGWGRWLKLALLPSLAAMLVGYFGVLSKMKLGFY